VEKRCPRPAKIIRDLDAHDPKAKQLGDQVGWHLGVLVHVSDHRTNALIRELVHTVAEDTLVLGQGRQGRYAIGRVWRHGISPGLTAMLARALPRDPALNLSSIPAALA
jgi:hypothetical protein